jgi:hypothetical protein
MPKGNVQEAKEENMTSNTVTMTTEEFEAVKEQEREKIRTEIARQQARAEVAAAAAAAEKSKQDEQLNSSNTAYVLGKQKKYKVTIQRPEGFDKVNVSKICVNGVDFPFTFDEPVILPYAAVDILKNSKIYGKPRVVETKNEAGEVVSREKKAKMVSKYPFTVEEISEK